MLNFLTTMSKDFQSLDIMQEGSNHVKSGHSLTDLLTPGWLAVDIRS